MSIIIMNLLTGLAVDDIQSIAENAELKKLSMQVELVLGLERIFSRLRGLFGGEHIQYEEINMATRRTLLWFRKHDTFSSKNILAQIKLEENDSGTTFLLKEKFESDNFKATTRTQWRRRSCRSRGISRKVCRTSPSRSTP